MASSTFPRKCKISPNLNLPSVHILQLGVLQIGEMEVHYKAIPRQTPQSGMHPTVMDPPCGLGAVDYSALGCTFTRTPLQGPGHFLCLGKYAGTATNYNKKMFIILVGRVQHRMFQHWHRVNEPILVTLVWIERDNVQLARMEIGPTSSCRVQ